MAFLAATHGHHSPQSYRDLSRNEMHQLAQILSYQPLPTTAKDSHAWKSYAVLTKQAITELPARLKHSTTAVSRCVNRYVPKVIRREYNEFCPVHQRLNHAVVRSIMHWVQDEVDHNIDWLVYRFGYHHGNASMSTNQELVFGKALEASAMWLSSAAYHRLHDRPPLPKWELQKDLCAACVLARLGGEKDILCALRVAMLVRCSPLKLQVSKRFRLLNTWIAASFEENVQEEILKASNALGEEVRKLWHAHRNGDNIAYRDRRTFIEQEEPDRGWGDILGQGQQHQDHDLWLNDDRNPLLAADSHKDEGNDPPACPDLSPEPEFGASYQEHQNYLPPLPRRDSILFATEPSGPPPAPYDPLSRNTYQLPSYYIAGPAKSEVHAPSLQPRPLFDSIERERVPGPSGNPLHDEGAKNNEEEVYPYLGASTYGVGYRGMLGVNPYESDWECSA